MISRFGRFKNGLITCCSISHSVSGFLNFESVYLLCYQGMILLTTAIRLDQIHWLLSNWIFIVNRLHETSVHTSLSEHSNSQSDKVLFPRITLYGKITDVRNRTFQFDVERIYPIVFVYGKVN